MYENHRSQYTYIDSNIDLYMNKDLEEKLEREYRTSIQIYKKTAMRLKAIASSENETYDMIIKRLLKGRVNHNDYIYLLRDGKYIAEHRFIMSKHLGRPLEDGEIVHHIDGNSRNNILSNLELMTPQEHFRLHGNPNKNIKN